MSKVDAILPIYKANDIVFETIDSIMNQTYKGWHLIVVDDASNDGMLQVIKSKYRGNEHKMSFFELKKNIQASGARNYGFGQGTGKYIAFIDQDDLWLPDKLEKQVQLFERNREIGASHTDIKVLDENNGGKIVEDLLENQARSKISWENSSRREMMEIIISRYPMRLTTTMIRRDVYDLIGGYNENIFGAEDMDLWLRISEKYNIGYIPEKLTIRRKHRFNVSKKYKYVRNAGHLNWVLSLKKNSSYSFLKGVFLKKEKKLLEKGLRLAVAERKYLNALLLTVKMLYKYPAAWNYHFGIVRFSVKLLSTFVRRRTEKNRH